MYQLLLDEDYVDWASTALFYTAVHVVEAWLVSSIGMSSGNHDGRALRMHRLGVPRLVFEAYDSLRRASELARYRNWPPVLNADRLTRLHNGPYRVVCEQFDAPEAIIPQ